MWDGVWKSPPARRSKSNDPHQLRVNSYRVLLTRGREGFIVFVPNKIGMRSMYEMLMERGEGDCGGRCARYNIREGKNSRDLLFIGACP